MDANYDDMVGLESLGVTQTSAPPFHLEPELFSDLLPGDSIALTPYEDEDQPQTKLPMTPWPPRLPLELALGAEEEQTILERYEISPQRYDALKQNLSFRRAMADAQRQIREEGLGFKAVCGRMSDEMLEDLYIRFFDRHTTLNQKHDLFKTITRYAGREPVPDKGAVQQAVQVNIQINGL